MFWLSWAMALIIPSLDFSEKLMGPTVEVVNKSDLSSFHLKWGVLRDCGSMYPNAGAGAGHLIDEVNKVIDTVERIVLIGEKVWKIIDQGKPSYQWRRSWVAALPEGVSCWDELEMWKAPRAVTYRIYYRNLWGIKVVDFGYRIELVFGGKYKDRGAYIAYASVVPTQVNVLWGYKLQAQTVVQGVVNLGSKVSPVAGISLRVEHKVETTMKVAESSEAYFLTGLGEIRRINP